MEWKKYFTMLLLFSLVATLLVHMVIPAYAAAPYDADWIPPVPEFIIQDNGIVSIQGQILDGAVKQNEELSDFWCSVGWNRPFIVLLDQGVYNKYNEEHGIEYDKQFSIYVVCPDKKSDDTYYDFGVFEHTGGPQHFEQMNVPSPMTYFCLNNPHSFMKYIYNPENGGSWVLQPSVSHLPGGSGSQIRFTYVLAAGFEYDFLNTLRKLKNGTFSEPSELYPYFTQVAGNDFGVGTAFHQQVEGETVYHYRCYDWWLGIQGDEIPPWPPGFEGDSGGGSSGGSSSGGGDSGGGSSGGSSSGGGDSGGSSSGGSSSGGGDSGGGSSGGSSSGGGDSGGGSSGGSSSGGGDSGGGSSGGSSSGGGDSGGGSSSDRGDPPDTWFTPDDDLPHDPWEFFDPFKPQTPPIIWDDDYDPRKPGDPIYDDYDPFAALNRLLLEMFGGRDDL